jgi:hypothetical protein
VIVLKRAVRELPVHVGVYAGGVERSKLHGVTVVIGIAGRIHASRDQKDKKDAASSREPEPGRMVGSSVKGPEFEESHKHF